LCIELIAKENEMSKYFSGYDAFYGKNGDKKKWGQAPFCKKEDILNLRTEHQKMGPVPIFFSFFAFKYCINLSQGL